MKQTTPAAWPILGILLGAQLAMAMGALGYGTLAPYLRETYGISRSQVGFLITLFYFTCALAAIPAGIIVDRVGARLMLISCLLMEGVPYAAMTLAGDYFFLVVCAALSGIGYAFINQVSTKGIMEWFSSRTRATAMGIKQSGVTIGGAAAAWLFPALSVAYDWKWGVLSISLMMFVMAVIATLLYRAPPPDALQVPLRAHREERLQPHRLFTIIRRPMLMMLLLVAPFLAFSQGCLVSFLVLYLKEELHLPMKTAGACMTAAMIAATVGRIGWGAVSDVIFRGDRVKPLLMLSILGSTGVAGLALLSEHSSLGAIFLWSMLLGLTLSGWNGVIMVLSAELGEMTLVASVVSIVVTIVGFGFLAGPVAFGYVVDRTGYFAGWMLALGSSLVSVLGFLRMLLMREKKT